LRNVDDQLFSIFLFQHKKCQFAFQLAAQNRYLQNSIEYQATELSNLEEIHAWKLSELRGQRGQRGGCTAARRLGLGMAADAHGK
jgi:hypothetical protein